MSSINGYKSSLDTDEEGISEVENKPEENIIQGRTESQMDRI